MKDMLALKKKMESAGDNSLKVVLILYDASIGFLEKAIGFAEKEDRERKELFTGKANDIIVELDRVLDMRSGGDIAKNLKLLYSFMNRQLVDASENNTVKGLVDVRAMMKDLRDSWRFVDESSQTAVA